MKGINGGIRRRGLVFNSPWGWMGVSETAKGIDRIVLPAKSKRTVATALGAGDAQNEESARLVVAKCQLLEYMAGVRKTFDFPIDISHGTLFQRRVWRVV
ncbi:MAG: hypothetical protein NZM29_00635, partial [Nitrospira sp.]|nr:hypothetical protein [Nitrospira sp.]